MEASNQLHAPAACTPFWGQLVGNRAYVDVCNTLKKNTKLTYTRNFHSPQTSYMQPFRHIIANHLLLFQETQFLSFCLQRVHTKQYTVQFSDTIISHIRRQNTYRILCDSEILFHTYADNIPFKQYTVRFRDTIISHTQTKYLSFHCPDSRTPKNTRSIASSTPFCYRGYGSAAAFKNGNFSGFSWFWTPKITSLFLPYK